MLGIILAALIGCGRVYPAMLNSSSSTQVGQEWWHTLPRAIVPNGPLIWPTDAPTAILFDQHPPPIMNLSKASLEYTGREGAKINMYLNPFTTLSDPSLASKCGGQWSAELTKYIQTGHITIFYPGGPAEYANDWNFIPKSPCCGQCSIGGIYAELMYWPTPAPTPAVTALVDKSGFTFISPSAYLVFKSLRAHDACGQIGQFYQNQTLSFGSAELSTSRGIHDSFGLLDFPFDYSWTAFNYAEIANSSCTDIAAYSIAEEHYTNTKGVTVTGDANTWFYNPCFPFLSLPTQVLGLDPAWSTCVHDYGAFYDPPKILKSADGLLAPVDASTTTGSDGPVQTGGPTAGQLIQLPATVTATVAYTVPNPTPPPDPKPVDPHPQNSQPQTPPPENSQTQAAQVQSPPHRNLQPQDHQPQYHQDPNPADPVLTSAQDPQAPPTPKNSLTKPIPEAPANLHPGVLQDPPDTNSNRINDAGTQPPTLVAPLIYISGEKVVEGAPPTTIAGKVIAYSSGSLYVGDKIEPVSMAIPQAYPDTSINVDGLSFEMKAPPPPGRPDNTDHPTPIITSGPSVIVAQQNYHIVVDSQTIVAGGPAQTISGTRISLAPSATAIIVGENTVQIPNASNPPLTAAAPAVTLTLGSSTYTTPLSLNLVIGASNSQFAAAPKPFIVVEGQTLLAGGEAKTISGTRISLAPSATAIVVAGTVIPITDSAPGVAIVLPLGSSTYTATLSMDQFVSGIAQTLFPGSVITLGGRPISLDSGGRGRGEGLGAVILGGFNNGPDGAHAGSTPVAGVIVVGGDTITPSPILVDGRTVYVYPSGAVLMGSGGTVLYTGSGPRPFPPGTSGGAPVNNGSSIITGVNFFTGGTSSLRLTIAATPFCGWVYSWVKIIGMIPVATYYLSVILAL